MARIESFSISPEWGEQIGAKVDQLKRDRKLSEYLCEAIQEKMERQDQSIPELGEVHKEVQIEDDIQPTPEKPPEVSQNELEVYLKIGKEKVLKALYDTSDPEQEAYFKAVLRRNWNWEGDKLRAPYWYCGECSEKNHAYIESCTNCESMKRLWQRELENRESRQKEAEEKQRRNEIFQQLKTVIDENTGYTGDEWKYNTARNLLVGVLSGRVALDDPDLVKVLEVSNPAQEPLNQKVAET